MFVFGNFHILLHFWNSITSSNFHKLCLKVEVQNLKGNCWKYYFFHLWLHQSCFSLSSKNKLYFAYIIIISQKSYQILIIKIEILSITKNSCWYTHITHILFTAAKWKKKTCKIQKSKLIKFNSKFLVTNKLFILENNEFFRYFLV